MLFWNNDYSQGLKGPHAASHIRGAASYRPGQCCWLCHLSSDGLVESDCKHRKYTGLPRRIDRNEYYFALLYIVHQVTIPYSACSFGGTPRCFDVLKSRAGTKGTVSRMRADPDVLGVVNTGHRCDSQKISVFRCEYYRSQYRLSI